MFLVRLLILFVFIAVSFFVLIELVLMRTSRSRIHFISYYANEPGTPLMI